MIKLELLHNANTFCPLQLKQGFEEIGEQSSQDFEIIKICMFQKNTTNLLELVKSHHNFLSKNFYHHLNSHTYKAVFRVIVGAVFFGIMDSGHEKAVFYNFSIEKIDGLKVFMKKFFSNENLCGEIKKHYNFRLSKLTKEDQVKDREFYSKFNFNA
jgi:hypothetical protein